MVTATSRTWQELDAQTRRKMDARFLEELRMWCDAPLNDDAIRVYLAYRHERPEAAVTTYEEGQIRKMLHRYATPADRPDPVAAEEHLDPLEVFGATKLHMTNDRTYLMVMIVLTLSAISIGMFWAILR